MKDVTKKEMKKRAKITFKTMKRLWDTLPSDIRYVLYGDLDKTIKCCEKYKYAN